MTLADLRFLHKQACEKLTRLSAAMEELRIAASELPINQQAPTHEQPLVRATMFTEVMSKKHEAVIDNFIAKVKETNYKLGRYRFEQNKFKIGTTEWQLWEYAIDDLNQIRY